MKKVSSNGRFRLLDRDRAVEINWANVDAVVVAGIQLRS